jgi:hypothetical protein
MARIARHIVAMGMPIFFLHFQKTEVYWSLNDGKKSIWKIQNGKLYFKRTNVF